MEQDFSNLQVARLKYIMTMDCNFRCDYCFEGGKSHNHLDPAYAIEVGKQVLEQTKQQLITVLYFGGEPLLRFQDIKLITQALLIHAKKIGKQINFTTISNGSILSDDIVKHFKNYKYYISISCDGIESAQSQHRRYMHGDNNTFGKVLESIRILNENTKDFCISMVVTDYNVKYLAESFQYFIDLGVRNFAISPVLDDIKYTPNPEVYHEQLAMIAEIANGVQERLVVNPPLDVTWDDNNVTRAMTMTSESVNLEVTPLGINIIPEKTVIKSIDFSLKEDNSKIPADTALRQQIIKAERNASKLYNKKSKECSI